MKHDFHIFEHNKLEINNVENMSFRLRKYGKSTIHKYI